MTDGISFNNSAKAVATNPSGASANSPASPALPAGNPVAVPALAADAVIAHASGGGNLYPSDLHAAATNRAGQAAGGSTTGGALSAADQSFISNSVAQNLPMLTPSERQQTAADFQTLATKLATADPATAKELVQSARTHAINDSNAFGGTEAIAKGIGSAFDQIGKQFSPRDEQLSNTDKTAVNGIVDATILPELSQFDGAARTAEEALLREQTQTLAQTVKNSSPSEAAKIREAAHAAQPSSDPFTEAGRQAALQIIDRFSRG